LFVQLESEAARCPHWANSVRARRPNADLKDLEDTGLQLLPRLAEGESPLRLSANTILVCILRICRSCRDAALIPVLVDASTKTMLEQSN